MSSRLSSDWACAGAMARTANAARMSRRMMLELPLAGFADEEVAEHADALGILEGRGIDEIGLVGRQFDADEDAFQLRFALGDIVGQHGDADAGAASLQHAVDGVDL